jgi:secretion/DNA translocation related TadE-like protein
VSRLALGRSPPRIVGRLEDERGSVTVVAAAVLAMALVLALGGADLARTLIAQARGQTAADAAALAAAQELAVPRGLDPAEMAQDYAERNGGQIVTCDCDSGASEATVEVRVPVGPLLLFPDDRVVLARARATISMPSPAPVP